MDIAIYVGEWYFIFSRKILINSKGEEDTLGLRLQNISNNGMLSKKKFA